MRFFPLFSIALATACVSDYHIQTLTRETAEAETIYDGNTATETISADEPSEDENLDDDGCWFGAWEYFGDYEIGVKTLPVYRLVSPTEVTVAPGEDVTLSFAVSSHNECGDLNLNMLFFGVFDHEDGSYEWLKEVNDDALSMSLEDMSGESEFGTSAASNMYATPTGDQLHYVWRDDVAARYSRYPENMSTQQVRANEERFYDFIWTASDYAPSGTTMTISLTEVCWTDVTTNGSPCSTRQGLESIGITVHIE